VVVTITGRYRPQRKCMVGPGRAQRDLILVITINLPEAKNAVQTPEGEKEGEGEGGELRRCRAVGFGVLTGAGASFCSFMDLKAFSRWGKRRGRGPRMGVTTREKRNR